MHEHPLQVAEGHLITALDDGPWLIDTGSPMSTGRGDVVRIGGREAPVGDGLGLVDMDEIARLTGIELAGLLGMDVLGVRDVRIDVPAGRLVIARALEPEPGGIVLPVERIMGCPVVRAEVDGIALRVVVDTGASITYLEHEGLEAFPDAGTFEDFHPLQGRFTTRTRTVPVRLGGHERQLRCGRLPEMLSALLVQLAGTSGILGNELFADGPVLLSGDRLVLEGVADAAPGADQADRVPQ